MNSSLRLAALALVVLIAYSVPSESQAAASSGGQQGPTASTANPAPTPSAAADDKTLKTEVQAELAKDSAFQDLSVDVNHGVVTLKGKVPTRADRDRAKDVVGHIRGVQQVQDFIQAGDQQSSGAASVQPSSNPAQQNAASAPAQAPAANNQNESKGANPESPATSPTLPATSGAGANISDLPQSDIETGGASNSDQLQSEIQTGIGKEPTLDGSSIKVAVKPTTIELTGETENAKQKITARRIAESYANNRRVVDKITVNYKAPAAAQQPSQQQPQ